MPVYHQVMEEAECQFNIHYMQTLRPTNDTDEAEKAPQA